MVFFLTKAMVFNDAGQNFIISAWHLNET